MKKINIIGAGLAGSDAACYLAKKGYEVVLYDIKPNNFTPAHKNPLFGELVCSNSLKSDDVFANACGLLKQEMRLLGSVVIACADETKIPAGRALAVNRDEFAAKITEKIKSFDNIKVVCKEITEIDRETPTIIATGPLTTDALSRFISENFANRLYFYDAAAPIVSADSIDMSEAFVSDRYGDGEGDYLNCPIDKEGYIHFYEELVKAKTTELKSFEDVKLFEGCMPVEEMAKRGIDTLRFGPLKPVGLFDPKTKKRPYACMQLRKENMLGENYNLVGFQTNLKWEEQKRVFSIFPALKNAEYIRYGVMHRNTYLESPEVLGNNYCLKKEPFIYFAGQITGVEGYVESAASGLTAAISLDRKLSGKEDVDFTFMTVLGALEGYCRTQNANFQPMNANYGIISPLNEEPKDKKLKKLMLGERSLQIIEKIKTELNI